MLSTLSKKFKRKNLKQNLYLIYGINEKRIQKICQNVGVHPTIEYSVLSKTKKEQILKYIKKNITIERKLRKEKKESGLFLEKVKNRRSIRNKYGLPSHGQRTHTNRKTKKKLKNGF